MVTNVEFTINIHKPPRIIIGNRGLLSQPSHVRLLYPILYTHYITTIAVFAACDCGLRIIGG